MFKSVFGHGAVITRLYSRGRFTPIIPKSVKYARAQRIRIKNEILQAKLNDTKDKIDPVFGRPNTPFISRIMASINEPDVLSHNYSKPEVEKLMASLQPTERDDIIKSGFNEEIYPPQDLELLENKREAILRILNMKNASNKEKVKLARKLAVQEFERFPGDTGSSEVQAACLTMQILSIAQHAKDHRKDFANTRKLRMLVQQRQNILKYLKRDKPERYFWAIEKLGLDDYAVTHEFHLGRRYMQDFKFFGDKTLVKETRKQLQEKRKLARYEKVLPNLNKRLNKESAKE